MKIASLALGIAFALSPFTARAESVELTGKAATQMALLLKSASNDKANTYNESIRENLYYVSLKTPSTDTNCTFELQFVGGEPKAVLDDRASCRMISTQESVLTLGN